MTIQVKKVFKGIGLILLVGSCWLVAGSCFWLCHWHLKHSPRHAGFGLGSQGGEEHQSLVAESRRLQEELTSLQSCIGETQAEADRWQALRKETALPQKKEEASGTINDAERETALVREMIAADGGEMCRILNRIGIRVDEDFPTLLAKSVRSDYEQILMCWGRLNPRAALDWVAGDSNRWQYCDVSDIVCKWASQSPDEVLAYTREHGSLFGDEIMDGWIEAMVRVDFQKAAAVVLQSGNNRMIYHAAFYLADRDPIAAAEWVEQSNVNQLLTDRERRYCVKMIGENMIPRDLGAAIEWAQKIPLTADRVQILVQASQEWAERDPEGLRNWWEGLPPGSFRDEMTVACCCALAHGDPETMMDWLENIADPEFRNKIMFDGLQDNDGLFTSTITVHYFDRVNRLADRQMGGACLVGQGVANWLCNPEAGGQMTGFTDLLQWLRRDPNAFPRLLTHMRDGLALKGSG